MHEKSTAAADVSGVLLYGQGPVLDPPQLAVSKEHSLVSQEHRELR